jgi:hypothetical protein
MRLKKKSIKKGLKKLLELSSQTRDLNHKTEITS